MLLLTTASKHPDLAIAACLKARLFAAIKKVLDNFTKGLARHGIVGPL
jgi:hypothetical protein